MCSKNTRERFLYAVRTALPAAAKNILWLLKLMLPISLGITVAQQLGFIAWLSDHLTPVMGVVGLSGSSSLVFLSAVFANIYAAIGVMASLNLDYRSVTILATMCLIAHNMIIETWIQKKTGASAIYMIVLRLGSAWMAAFFLNLILPHAYSGTLHLPEFSNPSASWAGCLISWVKAQGSLVIKVICIVLFLQVLQNVLREFKWIDRMTRPLKPLVVSMGMSAKMTFLWIVANTLGLGYGGAVLYDEVQSGEYRASEVNGFNTSIALTHSLLEDTLLFAVIGVALPWLIFPRLLMSVGILWLERWVRSRVPILAYHENAG